VSYLIKWELWQSVKRTAHLHQECNVKRKSRGGLTRGYSLRQSVQLM